MQILTRATSDKIFRLFKITKQVKEAECLRLDQAIVQPVEYTFYHFLNFLSGNSRKCFRWQSQGTNKEIFFGVIIADPAPLKPCRKLSRKDLSVTLSFCHWYK